MRNSVVCSKKDEFFNLTKVRERACAPEYKLNFPFLGCKCMVFAFNKEVFLDLEKTYHKTESEIPEEAFWAAIKYGLDLAYLGIIEKKERKKV